MPEVYEVRRIASYLRQSGIEGKQIKKLRILPGGEKILRQHPLHLWEKYLVGQTLQSLTTKGKYTLLHLEHGTLLWHYRFTGIPHIQGLSYKGQLETIFNLPITLQPKYCRFELHFSSAIIVKFIDTRCLSSVQYIPTKNLTEILPQLADDLSNYQPYSFSTWQKAIARKKRDIKMELQNQHSYPSGIGNYLACEILARAKLNPWRSIATLSKIEYLKLCEALLTVKNLCEDRVDYDWFQVFCAEFCLVCNTKIVRKKHRHTRASQTTHYCPSCQS